MTKLKEGSEAIRQALRTMPLGCFANEGISEICYDSPCECCEIAFRAAIKALMFEKPGTLHEQWNNNYLQFILDEK